LAQKNVSAMTYPVSSGTYNNSLGDEIANVNLFTTISHTYFKMPKENLLRLAN